MTGGALNIAWAYMQVTFNVPLEALGALVFVATTGSLLAAFGSGVFIGRFGTGRVILAGVGLVVVGLAGFSLAPIWVVLLIVTFFLYMGRGTLDAGMNNFLSVHYGTTEMNWLHAAWGLGLTIAPASMGFLIVTLGQGWRVGYAILAILFVVILAAVFITLPRWRVMDTPDESDDPVQAAKVMETLRQPIVLISILFFMVYGAAEIGTGQLTNTLLTEARGIDPQTSSLWVSLYWGSFTVGRMLIGVIALRLSDARIMQGSMVLSLIGAFTLAFGGQPYTALVGLMLIGFGFAAIFPVLISQTPARVGREHAPNAIGFQIGIAGMGAFILPTLSGLLSVQFGLEIISRLIFINTVLMITVYVWLVVYDGRKAKRG